MLIFILRRVVSMLILLVIINFVAFSYAHYGRFVQLESNPIFARHGEAESVIPYYEEYINGFLKGEPVPIPTAGGLNVWDVVSLAAKNSLGLLGIAFCSSLALGIWIGINSVKINPPRIARWLIPISAVSLAMPGFYIGALLITLSVYFILYTPGTHIDLPFPLGGFGWDEHLVFPLIALSFRPTIQISQTTATLLSEEFNRRYVAVARSLGHSWRLIKIKTALRNIYVSLAQVIASSFSVMLGELILVEWLFGWPGLGKQLASSIQPPIIVSIASAVLPSSYLHPPTVATIITTLSAILIVTNTLVNIFTYLVDPRLRPQEQANQNG